MEELVPTLLRLAAVIFLVLLNGFFVATEFALVSVRRTRVQELIDSGESKNAQLVMESLNDPNRFVSATQVGITMSSLALGWLGEPAVAVLLEQPLHMLGLGATGIHTVSFIVAFLIITYLHVVVGEIAPKGLALQRPERLSLMFARPITFFYMMLRPLIYVLNSSAEVLLRMFKVDPAAGRHMFHSEEELKMLVSQSGKEGVLEDAEQQMLYNVFDFADKDAAEVMVPRPDVVALSIDNAPTEILQKIIEQPYTRYPVYRETMDDIVGILHIRDLINAAEKYGKDKVRVHSLLRPAHVVPESKSLAGLLTDFKRSKSHMALVVDEYGSLAGIVTLEDLIEEIVGEIDDEHDLPEKLFEQLSANQIRVDGKFPIEELNERFGLRLADEDYHTVGGFVFGLLGQQPHPGDYIDHEGVRLEVTATDGPRIVHVDITLPSADRPEGGDGGLGEHGRNGAQPSSGPDASLPMAAGDETSQGGAETP